MSNPPSNPFWEQVDGCLLTQCQFLFETCVNREELAQQVHKTLDNIENNYPRNPGKPNLIGLVRKLGMYYWKKLS